jgi:hypothetical protein
MSLRPTHPCCGASQRVPTATALKNACLKLMSCMCIIIVIICPLTAKCGEALTAWAQAPASHTPACPDCTTPLLTYMPHSKHHPHLPLHTHTHTCIHVALFLFVLSGISKTRN